MEGEAKDGEVKKCSYSFKDVQNPIFQEIKGKGNIYIYYDTGIITKYYCGLILN